MATLYAKILNQDKFIYHKLFSASFYKINGEDQRSDEIEIFINLKVNQNLTESDINNTDIKPQLEHQK